MKAATERHDCAARVYGDRNVGGWPCANRGSNYEEGEWWCAVHTPSKKAARRAASDTKWRQEADAIDVARTLAAQRALELSVTLGRPVQAIQNYTTKGVHGYHLALVDEYVAVVR